MSILPALAMILSVFTIVPITAGAAEITIAYVNAAGEDMGTRDCTLVTSDDTSWEDGWYAVMNQSVFSSIIYVSGTVNLILCDDSVIIANKGIVLKPDSHLIIWAQSGGNGDLRAYGDSYYAGIGGGYADETGSLTYSPMNYCYNVLGGTTDETLINVVKALYLYAEAADAYFTN